MAKPVAISLLLHLFLLSSTPFLAFCAADAVDPRPRELPTFKVQEIKKEVGWSSCSYTVKIKTSCSSVRYTRDWISLAFGDAYRNEVYAPRLDDPSSGAFERCSTDTFTIEGPCGYGVCYLYLRRDGWDGWTPDWVKIYEPGARRALTFYYGSALPNGIWYGFNHCPSASASDPTKQIHSQGMPMPSPLGSLLRVMLPRAESAAEANGHLGRRRLSGRWAPASAAICGGDSYAGDASPCRPHTLVVPQRLAELCCCWSNHSVLRLRQFTGEKPLIPNQPRGSGSPERRRRSLQRRHLSPAPLFRK